MHRHLVLCPIKSFTIPSILFCKDLDVRSTVQYFRSALASNVHTRARHSEINYLTSRGEPCPSPRSFFFLEFESDWSERGGEYEGTRWGCEEFGGEKGKGKREG